MKYAIQDIKTYLPHMVLALPCSQALIGDFDWDNFYWKNTKKFASKFLTIPRNHQKTKM